MYQLFTLPFVLMQKLSLDFYLQDDVVTIAKALLGKVLVTNISGDCTAGRIVETEAYAGETDKASHASKGRTSRTEVMYANGGRAYVYLCYGIHQMFNIVTAKDGVPHAVLIRAIEPLEGKDLMLERSGKKKWDASITSGPGRVGKAMGFHTSQCGLSLQSEELFVADDGFAVNQTDIVSSPRIGVDYAGDHAKWHYRFYLRGSSYISGKKK
ncbi:MAG TPA: DNA-3-methyladenine glycosylase [Flavisolibacter sp.]|jgi:DNA-3-methyladenine glycosylase|nr:DNA-3-methyladenine glycosylase [Flavisolibacter sp.]